LWKNLETGQVKWLVLALASYTVALFSKENAVTFVAIVPLVLYFFTKTDLKKIALTTGLFALPALVFVLVRKAVIGDLTNPGEVSMLDNVLMGASNDPAARSATAFLLLGKYLWTLLFPHPLGSDFGYNQIPLTNWNDWRSLLSLVAWLGIGAFGLIRLKKKDLWSFSILFFLINFSIFSNLIITIGTSYGDRLLYSASPGFTLVLALVLVKIFKVDEKEKLTTAGDLFKNKTLWLVAGGILLLYSIKTVTRNMDWETSYTLYHADIEQSPNSAKLNFHYGLELVKNGQEKGVSAEEQKQWYDKAKATFEKAISIYPSYHDAYGQLGLAYYREKNYEKALENYNLALKYKPNFPLVYSNMGIIFFETGDLAKAKECYENAVKHDPRFADALRNLGVVYAMQKSFTEAIKYFQQGLQYAPDDPALNRFLGQAFKDSGNEAAGLPYIKKAEMLEAQAK
jgi:tetratricopeptide (TPR) repeat protein